MRNLEEFRFGQLVLPKTFMKYFFTFIWGYCWFFFLHAEKIEHEELKGKGKEFRRMLPLVIRFRQVIVAMAHGSPNTTSGTKWGALGMARLFIVPFPSLRHPATAPALRYSRSLLGGNP